MTEKPVLFDLVSKTIVFAMHLSLSLTHLMDHVKSSIICKGFVRILFFDSKKPARFMDFKTVLKIYDCYSKKKLRI